MPRELYFVDSTQATALKHYSQCIEILTATNFFLLSFRLL